MKGFALLLVSMAFTLNTFAQKSTEYLSHLKGHHSHINSLLQKQISKSNILTDAPKRVLTERVRGQKTIDNMFVTYADSVNVSYVLNGTSTYDYNIMVYAYNYPYSTSPMFNFQGVHTKPQILFENYNHWIVNPMTLVYGFYQMDFNTYDDSTNLITDTTYFGDSLVNPNMIYTNKFNGANNVDTSYSNTFIGGVSAPAFKQFFSYNGSNLVTKDSIYEYDAGSWYLVSKTFYTYDVSNNLIQINQYSNTTDTTFLLPLILQFQYINTYDGSNRLKTVQTSFYDGAALNPYVRDTFNYTGASTFHTDWKEHQYDAINAYWAPQIFMQKNLNGASLPDSININSFDSLLNAWVPAFKQIISYNASNNPIKLDEYVFNFVTFPATPDFETTYYYETFTNTSGVNDFARENKDFTLFPNPNNGQMQLNYNLQEDALMNLYDYSGKKINSYKLLKGQNSFLINENGLTNGIYFYEVISANTVYNIDKFIVIR